MSFPKNLPSAYLLLGIQSLATVIWTFVASFPVWISITGITGWTGVSALGLAAISTALGGYRFVMHGEVTNRDFGIVPHLIRAVILCAPTHAIHGATVALFCVTWLSADSSFLKGDEDEREQQKDQAFFFYFMFGWVFSTMQFLSRHNHVKFQRISPKTRLANIASQMPEIAASLFVLLSFGIILGGGALTLLWTVVSFTFVIGDVIFRTILTEKTRAGDVDETSLTTIVSAMARGSVEECFSAFPIVFVGGVDASSAALKESEIIKMLPSAQKEESVQTWWTSRRNLLKYQGGVTGINSADFLVSLADERFKTVAQAIYRIDALDEGAAFAKRNSGLGFSNEALRMRAFARLASTEAPLLRVVDWCNAVNSCLDLLDAQALRLLCFCKVASPKIEPPRSPDTGLENTEAFFPAPTDENPEQTERRREKARDLQWDLDHKRFVGKLWWRRLVLGNFVWGFDPIYEECLERRGMWNTDRPTWLRRETQIGLVPDFTLMSRTSEALVTLVKKKRPANVSTNESAQVVAVVTGTLNRLIDAGEVAMNILKKHNEPSELVYGLLFCADRDLQVLRG